MEARVRTAPPSHSAPFKGCFCLLLGMGLGCKWKPLPELHAHSWTINKHTIIHTESDTPPIIINWNQRHHTKYFLALLANCGRLFVILGSIFRVYYKSTIKDHTHKRIILRCGIAGPFAAQIHSVWGAVQDWQYRSCNYPVFNTFLEKLFYLLFHIQGPLQSALLFGLCKQHQDAFLLSFKQTMAL